MKEADDIAILVEQHAKEIWALKQELSKASQELTVLHGTKGVVVSLSNELTRMRKRVEEAKKNRPLNTMDEVAYRELQAENEKLKKKVREAEGETSIVKGIGINSPEMKALRKENEELKADLARAKEDHQFDNLVHRKELETLSKKQ